MKIEHVAAFSDNGVGGNPAGVVIGETLPDAHMMRETAANLGYSETVFAAPYLDGWRVRYFSPESEVPFCGHATIALAAILARKFGNGEFHLHLNHTDIIVMGAEQAGDLKASLMSPLTTSKRASAKLVQEALDLFGWDENVLDNQIPPARINAGAEHLVLAFKSRQTLREMEYNLDHGRVLMRRNKLVTIALVYSATPYLFHVRNAFASGGVLEDPATGAAAAALCGYLRVINWPQNGQIEIIQGEDMGKRSRICCQFEPNPNSPVTVAGSVRIMQSVG
ncbi:MAG TPA: PhzF family phenazine biosynthesis protein [Hellea balneolensis]|uniref:PhzF family phenazine biosynthesis protein n=1 Tax=Hellea balneolensis TaxID=287478 RepID=A0A7C5R7R4_9PROT|nr:PhzF family phenazine biosynthesis protein [Hellea balneolensis]